MGLDRRITDAIRDVVQEAGQSSSLADKLVAWFEGLSSGNDSLDDKDSVARHLDLLYEVTDVEEEVNEQDGES